jgi:RNA polymerase sigma-70 factor (ECF subfamily)
MGVGMPPANRDAVESSIRALLDTGDLRSAATTVMREYGPQILGYQRAVLRDEGAAEEAFSRFAEGLWKGLARFRGEAAALTWAYRIAWGAVREVRREPYRRRARRLDTSEATQLVNEVRTSTASHLRSGARSAMERLRAGLDPAEQTLLILRLDRDLAWKDVALILSRDGLSLDEGAVRKRYERVKAKLRRLASVEGLLAAR